MRGNQVSFEAFRAIGGFDTLIKNVLLDQNEKRSPIGLKLKALNFISYVWQEHDINGLCRNCEVKDGNTDGVPKTTELKNVCEFFTSEDKLYSERKHPFIEGDSLQWIDQVVTTMSAFKNPCEGVWKQDKTNLKMLEWIKDSDNFVESQIADEEDGDVKEMYLNIQSKINVLLSISSLVNSPGSNSKNNDEL